MKLWQLVELLVLMPYDAEVHPSVCVYPDKPGYRATTDPELRVTCLSEHDYGPGDHVELLVVATEGKG